VAGPLFFFCRGAIRYSFFWCVWWHPLFFRRRCCTSPAPGLRRLGAAPASAAVLLFRQAAAHPWDPAVVSHDTAKRPNGPYREAELVGFFPRFSRPVSPPLERPHGHPQVSLGASFHGACSCVRLPRPLFRPTRDAPLNFRVELCLGRAPTMRPNKGLYFPQPLVFSRPGIFQRFPEGIFSAALDPLFLRGGAQRPLRRSLLAVQVVGDFPVGGL